MQERACLSHGALEMLHPPTQSPHHHLLETGHQSLDSGAGLDSPPPPPSPAALLGPASAPPAIGNPSTSSSLLSPAGDIQHATTRPASFNSRLSDLEQIHDRIRQRLALKKGLPLLAEPETPQSRPPTVVLDKSLNTGETSYSAVVSAYTLGNVRSALAPSIRAGSVNGDDDSDAGSDATLSAGFASSTSTPFADTPATNLSSITFDISDVDSSMAKKGKGKKASPAVVEPSEGNTLETNGGVSQFLHLYQLYTPPICL